MTLERTLKAAAKASFWKRLRSERVLYLLLLPTLLFFLIFRVWPILNMRLAFFQFRSRGPWVFAGLRYFNLIFTSPAFSQILMNTFIISFMKYILLFPCFVIFAILLNEIRFSLFRKYIQVISYLPHFLSWVVIAGIWINTLSVSGALNQITAFFGIPAQDFMTSRPAIRWILMFCEAWRSLGWDSIIFFTAIIAIDPCLYEAAELDGCGRLGMIFHIILPALIIPMVTIFILNLGFFLNAGFDQVLNFSNAAVESSIDILDTYIYRIGVEQGQYSLATAVGLIKGVFGIFLVLGTHLISKKVTGQGVW
jgi:putative aldouronate transport system permease protein